MCFTDLHQLDVDIALFPPGATVQTRDGGVKTMEELQVDDEILAFSVVSQSMVFTKVERFAPVDRNNLDYWAISTSDGTTIRLSNGQLIENAGMLGTKSVQDLKVGDSVLIAGGDNEEAVSASTVTKVERDSELKGGFFAPVTTTGTIIVDGILVISNDSLDREGGCFPSASLVLTKEGSVKTMRELKVGDEVLAYDESNQELIFSKVYMFAFRNPKQMQNYYEISTSDSRTITLTGTHLIYVNVKNLFIPTYAKDVKLGDIVFTYDRWGNDIAETTVTKILTNVPMEGYFAPITMSGNIIVDDILASSYGKLDYSPLLGLHGHQIIHAALWPFRIAHSFFGVSYDAGEDCLDVMPMGALWMHDHLLPHL
jgi:hypothetical protein